jgi:hypothetical protein
MTAERGSLAAVMPESLPSLVRRYGERVVSGVSVTSVRVGQTGEMMLKENSRPRRFSAIEEFAVERVAFTGGGRST